MRTFLKDLSGYTPIALYRIISPKTVDMIKIVTIPVIIGTIIVYKYYR
jgi:hypothetical protein